MDRLEFKATLTVDDAGAIEGIAWPFGSPDRVGDVINRGAFVKAVAPLPMLASHDQADTVGVWDQIEETAEGLKVKGRLLVTEVARAAEVRALIKAGAMRGLSIGFQSRKSAPRVGGGRTISDLELLEISVVAVPAHPGARITSAKELDMTEQTTPDLTAIEKKLADLGEDLKPVSALSKRIDQIEAKLNRPETGGDKAKEPTEERKAFGSYLRLGNQISEDDRKALNVSVDPQGGYLVPPELSSEIIRDLIEFSPVRSVASVRGISVPNVIYPTRGDITNAVWHGEMATRSESTITFGQKEMTTKELSTYVEISNVLMQDAPAAETEVRQALADDFGKKEATAFVWGDGVLQPEGFMVNPDIPYYANGHATVVQPDALVKMLYSMPAMYRNKGVWALNGTTLGVLRTLKDGQNNYIWQPSYQAGQPETILGRPVIELVDMPNVAADAFPILYGDFEAYRILDRLSMSTLVDPYTRATNGITRIHATRRVGGGVLQAARFKKLKMATS
jgi:HK97 family phage major capsid protein